MDIEPWGKRPTPLVPASIIAAIGDEPAPSSFLRLLGANAKIRDLGPQVWDSIERVHANHVSDLLRYMSKKESRFKDRCIYSKLPEEIPVLNYAFTTRTWNAVQNNSGIFQNNKSLTYEKALIEVPNFGIKSAIEMSCILECAVSKFLIENDEHLKLSYEQQIVDFFEQLATWWVQGQHQTKDFSQLLPAPNDRWPVDIQSSWEKLRVLQTQQLTNDLATLRTVPFIVESFLETTDKRLKKLMLERIFPPPELSKTLAKIGESFRVSRERVRQIEKQALTKLEAIYEEENSPVMARAREMRTELGNAVPSKGAVLQDALDKFTDDFTEDSREKIFAQSLLLWLAGPYGIHSDWLIADRNLFDDSFEGLINACNELGFIETDTVREILCNVGIRETFHSQWMEHKRFRYFLKVDGGVLFARGSVLDKSESILRYFGRPMTSVEIINLVGQGSERSARHRLMEDERFWRINKDNEFVLAGKPGYEEYTNIIDKIVQQLNLHKGSASYTYIVETISSRFNVKQTSVVAYLNTPMFAVDEKNNVRLAAIDEAKSQQKPLEEASCCYRTGDGNWCFRVELDRNHMRGSGSWLPNPFAEFLGCNPGEKITLETEISPVTITWLLHSTAGATMGSLKAVVEALQGEAGDYLFLIVAGPNSTFRKLKRSVVESSAPGVCRLCVLVGGECTNDEETAIERIAVALGTAVDSDRTKMLADFRSVLHSRGEDKLANMIRSGENSVDDYLKDVDNLL